MWFTTCYEQACDIKMIVFKWILIYLGGCSAKLVISSIAKHNSERNWPFDRMNRTSSRNTGEYLNKVGRFNHTISNEDSKLPYFHKVGKSPKSLRQTRKRLLPRPRAQDKQFFIPRPRPQPLVPFRLNPAAFLIPAIPTLVGTVITLNLFLLEIYLLSGLGAGLAWVASQQRPITTTFSDIGSPTTNVTVSETNTNTQTVTQTDTNTNTQTNTNNDADTVSSSSTNTETNTNTNNNQNCVCTCTNNVCTCNCG